MAVAVSRIWRRTILDIWRRADASDVSASVRRRTPTVSMAGTKIGCRATAVTSSWVGRQAFRQRSGALALSCRATAARAEHDRAAIDMGVVGFRRCGIRKQEPTDVGRRRRWRRRRTHCRNVLPWRRSIRLVRLGRGGRRSGSDVERDFIDNRLSDGIG
jgi:hypothetical protein